MLFIPVLPGAYAWFGPVGTIWAITVSEALCLVVAAALFVVRPRTPVPATVAA